MKCVQQLITVYVLIYYIICLLFGALAVCEVSVRPVMDYIPGSMDRYNSDQSGEAGTAAVASRGICARRPTELLPRSIFAVAEAPSAVQLP